jgi:hypothetical protein
VRLSPLGTSATDWPILPAPEDRWVWSIWWNYNWQGKLKYSEETCPSVTFSAKNPTWPDLGSNPGRRCGKPATNSPSCSFSLSRTVTQELSIKFDVNSDTPFYCTVYNWTLVSFIFTSCLSNIELRCMETNRNSCESDYIQGVSRRALQLWKSIQIYTEDIHNILNCHNVAKHCKFDARNSVRPLLLHRDDH